MLFIKFDSKLLMFPNQDRRDSWSSAPLFKSSFSTSFPFFNNSTSNVKLNKMIVTNFAPSSKARTQLPQSQFNTMSNSNITTALKSESNTCLPQNLQINKMSNSNKTTTLKGAKPDVISKSIDVDKKSAAIAARIKRREQKQAIINNRPIYDDFPSLSVANTMITDLQQKGRVKRVTVTRSTTSVRWRPLSSAYSITTMQPHVLDPTPAKFLEGKVIHLSGDPQYRVWTNGMSKKVPKANKIRNAENPCIGVSLRSNPLPISKQANIKKPRPPTPERAFRHDITSFISDIKISRDIIIELFSNLPCEYPDIEEEENGFFSTKCQQPIFLFTPHTKLPKFSDDITVYTDRFISFHQIGPNGIYARGEDFDNLVRLVHEDHETALTGQRGTFKYHIQGGSVSRAATAHATMCNQVTDTVDDLRRFVTEMTHTNPDTLENTFSDLITMILGGINVFDALCFIVDGHTMYGFARLFCSIGQTVMSELTKVQMRVKYSLTKIESRARGEQITKLKGMVAAMQLTVNSTTTEPQVAAMVQEMQNFFNTQGPPLPICRLDEHPISGELTAAGIGAAPPLGQNTMRLNRTYDDPIDFTYHSQGLGDLFTSPFALLTNLTMSSMPTLQKFNTIVMAGKNATYVLKNLIEYVPRMLLEFFTPLFSDALLVHDDFTDFIDRASNLQRLFAVDPLNIPDESVIIKLYDEAIAFRKQVTNSILKGSCPTLLAHVIKDLSAMLLSKRDYVQFKQKRYTPYAFMLVGPPGIGKSEALNVLASEMMTWFDDDLFQRDPILRDMVKKRTTYTMQPHLEYMDGYCHDAITIQDEVFALADGSQEVFLQSMLSCNTYVCPMASLNDPVIGKKSTTYTSAINAFASNTGTVNHLSAKFLVPASIARRFHVVVDCRKVGDFSPTFNHLIFDVRDNQNNVLFNALTINQLMYFLKESKFGVFAHFKNQMSIVKSDIRAVPFNLGTSAQAIDLAALYRRVVGVYRVSTIHWQIALGGIMTLTKYLTEFAVMYFRPRPHTESYVEGVSGQPRSRRAVRTYATEGLNDSTAEAVQQKVIQHMHRISTIRDNYALTTMCAMPLQGHSFLVPQHLLDFKGISLLLEWVEMERTYECTMADVVTLKIGPDLAILTFPKLPWQAASLYTKIISERDVAKVHDEHARLVSVVGNETKIYMTQIKPLTEKITYEGGTTTYTVCSGYSYSADTKNGDCGSPLIISNNAIPGKIVGFHVAGTAGYAQGISIAFTREMIEKHLQPHTPIEPANMCVAQGTMIQFATPEKPVFVDRDTCFVKFHHEPPLPQIKSPANLKIVDGVDPILTEIFKNSGEETTTNFLPELMQINDHLKDEFVFEPRLLSWEESYIGGCGLEPINLKTSCGYPLCLDYDKRDFFHVDESGVWTVINDLPLRLAKEMDAQLDTHPPDIIWKVSGKDEILKPNKRIRVFEIPPITYTLLFRRYFGAFIGWVNTNPLKCYTAIGMNPESPQWDDMVRSMLSRNEVGFSIDWTRYDSTIPYFLFDAILDLMDKTYGMEYSRQRRNLIHSVKYRVVVFSGKVFLEIRGLPSGFPGTAVFNSIFHIYIIINFYLTHAPTHLRDYTYFKRHVFLAVYGDDGNIVPSPLVANIFDWNVFKTYASSFGMIPTPASKDEQNAHCRVLDMTFLKRSIGYQHSMYVPLLAEESLFSMLTWLRKSKFSTIRETYLVNLRLFFFYAYFHGRTFSEKWHKSLHCAHEIPGWEYFDAVYRTGETQQYLENVTYEL